jgi:hypothetical protein
MRVFRLYKRCTNVFPRPAPPKYQRWCRLDLAILVDLHLIILRPRARTVW